MVKNAVVIAGAICALTISYTVHAEDGDIHSNAVVELQEQAIRLQEENRALDEANRQLRLSASIDLGYMIGGVAQDVIHFAESSGDVNTLLKAEDKILLRFTRSGATSEDPSEDVSVNDAGFLVFTITNRRTGVTVLSLGKDRFTDTERGRSWLVVSTEIEENRPSHGDILELKVQIGDGTNAPRSESVFARWFERVSLYPRRGFWIPIGLVSTNFQSNDEGIPFAPMPVGVAWGVRLNFRKQRYIGLSAFANWTIPSASGNNDSPAVPDFSGSFSMASIGLGGLFDVGGWVVLGGAYVRDFTDHDHSGVFVFGLGPRALGVVSNLRRPD